MQRVKCMCSNYSVHFCLYYWLIKLYCRLKDGSDLEESAKYRMTYRDGVATLFIVGLEVEDAGQITCKATNEFGSVKTKANLTIEAVRHRRKRREEAEVRMPKPK